MEDWNSCPVCEFPCGKIREFAKLTIRAKRWRMGGRGATLATSGGNPSLVPVETGLRAQISGSKDRSSRNALKGGRRARLCTDLAQVWAWMREIQDEALR